MINIKNHNSAITLDASAEVQLPDYLPEIRRVLSLRASASIDGKYLTGDEMEADGAVVFTLIYIGGDGELAQASETASFTARTPLMQNSTLEAADIILSCAVEGNPSVRVTGPRRAVFSAKVRLDSYASSQSAEISDKIVTSVGEARCLTKKIATASLSEIRKTFEISGELRCGEGADVVSAFGDVLCFEIKPVGGEVNVKGEARITCLLRRGDEGGVSYFTVRDRVPIDEKFHDEGILFSLGKQGAAVLFPSVNLVELESGEGGVMAWTMEYSLDIDTVLREDGELVLDAYIPECAEDTPNKKSVLAVDSLCAVNGRISTQESFPLPEGSKNAIPFFSWGRVKNFRAVKKGGKLCVTGDICASVILESSSEGEDGVLLREISSCELVLPLKYECDSSAGGDGAVSGRIYADVIELNPRIDGDKMTVTAETALCLLALEETELSPVVSVIPGEGTAVCEGNVMRVYVADEGEEKWEIEKKFRLRAPLEGERVFVI